MMMWTLTGLQKMLSLAQGTGPLPSLFVVPFSTPLTGPKSLDWANFTLTTVAGFAAQAVVFPAPTISGCDVQSVATPLVFAASSLSGLPQSVAGWLIYWNDGTNHVLAVNWFDGGPISIAHVGDSFVAGPSLQLG